MHTLILAALLSLVDVSPKACSTPDLVETSPKNCSTPDLVGPSPKNCSTPNLVEPSPETCSTPDLIAYYDIGYLIGSLNASNRLGDPINCDTIATTTDMLTRYAHRMIALAIAKPPTSSCAYFGVGKSILEAVEFASTKCP